MKMKKKRYTEIEAGRITINVKQFLNRTGY